jgi:hypothetical protein
VRGVKDRNSEQKGRADHMAELENTNIGAEQDSEPTPKTYTEAEVKELLQKEGDRRVTEAQKKFERKQADREREAAKLSRMDDIERERYENEKRAAELDEREAKLRRDENRAAASNILAKDQIDLAGVDLVVDGDAEVMNERIKLLRKVVATAKAQMLAGNSPKKAPEQTEGITKEMFNKMTLAEQQHLFDTDRELYNKLVQR